MRPISSSLERPVEGAVGPKVGAILASIVILYAWPATYTSPVAKVAGSRDSSFLLRLEGAVRHGIALWSKVVELHGSRLVDPLTRLSMGFNYIVSLTAGVSRFNHDALYNKLRESGHRMRCC